jgi:hypothetical protein
LNGPSGAEGKLTEEEGSLPELLERLAEGLRRRIIIASVRSPESLFDELEDLNLVLELRERIEEAG